MTERLTLLSTGNVAGTPYEREVVDWEIGRRGIVQVSGVEELRRTQRLLEVALATVLFGISAVLPILTAAG